MSYFSFLNTLLRLPDPLRDVQLKLLTNYASGQGFTVVEKYVDVETAKQTGQSGLAEMVNYFKKQHKPTTQKESRFI
ncbi:MAG: hypothetical protein MUP27_14780 [Desulfobacterales bacterium]|nr:hypothetical protein [Desulfobacterales bacterium]